MVERVGTKGKSMIGDKTSGAGFSTVQRQLLDRLLEGRVSERTTERIVRLQPGMRVPLSPAQARIWFVNRMYPASAEYNVLGPTLRFQVDASRERVGAALRSLMQRHDALRLRILVHGDDPLQEECTGLEPPFAWHDLSGMPLAEAHRQATELGNLAARTPFQLDQAPLFRALAIRLSAASLQIFMVAHHIIVDGWSLDILYDELHALLLGSELPPPAEVRYLDYVSWERANVDERRLSQQIDYWKRKLGGKLPLLDVPKDRPWTTVRGRGGHGVPCSIPCSVMQRANELAADEGTTLFVTLLAAYKVLLLRLTGQSDVIVGSPLAGRDHPVAETLVGSFAKIVALRTDLGGDPSFRETVRRVRATVLEAQDNQLVPFERVVAELKTPRDLNCSPIFQTVFGLHSSSGLLRHSGTECSDVAYDSETSKWELSLTLIESAQDVSGHLEYASDLFDRSTAARYVDIYTRLLSALLAQPDRPITEHTLLSAEEETRILRGLRGPVPWAIPYTTLAGPFEEQVRRTPEAIALISEDGVLTYRELNENANRLAHVLRQHGVEQGGWVAVCMERSLAMVTALYAIAKTGAAYVPLDPQAPSGRIRFQLEDTESRLVLTHTPAVACMPDGPWRTLCMEEIVAQANMQSPEDRHCDLPATHLAYLMYTSGSTGRPKAVAFPVDAALSSVFWLQRCYPVKEGDRHILKTPYAFDVSLWELFWPLSFGGALVVCRPDGHLNPKYLAELIEQHQVTSICFVPSMLQAFLDEITPGSCGSLRWVHCGGEALTPRLRDTYHRRLGAALINGCGPTETHAVAMMEIVPNEGCPWVPLGRPVAGYRLYVLDDNLQPRPIGVPGELYIGGEVGLAQGYHRRPDLTAERFLPDPFAPAGARMYRTGDICRYGEDQVLEHLGRRDTQVKIHGARIELAEIETVLCEHQMVRSAVVLSARGEGGERLVGFVVPQSQVPFEADAVLHQAGTFLPRHMIPAALVRIHDIPRTPNGKVDRESLLARWREVQDTADLKIVAPAGAAEERLQRIFQQVLNVESASVTASFFDLGGHSLLIFKLISACEHEFSFRPMVADIFKAPSVRELAARIDSAMKAPVTPLVPLSPQRGKPIIVFIHGAGGSAMPFIEVTNRLGSDFSVFALQAPGLEDERSPFSSIDDLAASYVEAVDAIRGLSPLVLAGWSMGGCVGLEMARHWRQRGLAVAALLMIDSWVPPGALATIDARAQWRRELLDLDLRGNEPLESRNRIERTWGADGAARLERMMDANRSALLDYDPSWFDGEVDYLRAADGDDAIRFPAICLSADRGWGAHVRSVTVHSIAGNHFTLMTQEHAAGLAQTIRQIVNARLAFSQV